MCERDRHRHRHRHRQTGRQKEVERQKDTQTERVAQRENQGVGWEVGWKREIVTDRERESLSLSLPSCLSVCHSLTLCLLVYFSILVSHSSYSARGGQQLLGCAGVLMDGRPTRLQLQATTRNGWPRIMLRSMSTHIRLYFAFTQAGFNDLHW